jgi:teichuronic acid biosynthesis glycosyltransferase TuaC
VSGTAARPLRVLTFSSLFPSTARPRHGIFVETRLVHLRHDFGVDARVVAPVPWFPFKAEAFGSYAKFAATPRQAVRDDGLMVSYPRYLMLPKIGVNSQPERMARGALPDILRWQREGWQADVIDAHYLYPDGVAAAMVARRLRLPFVMTARGTDVNILAQMDGPRQRIAEAAARAAAVITVSAPLKKSLVEIGVDASKITVLRNGVDLDVFGLEDRAASRVRMGLPVRGSWLANVGNLVPEKGQDLAIDALAGLEEFGLVIVGDGPQRADLIAHARELGVADRVVFKPAMPQRELRHLYGAADALLLTSSREGWPNVVLEALASGTPVVSFEVGAVKEMLTDDRVGRVVPSRSAAALAEAVRSLLRAPIPRGDLRRHAAEFDWTSISRGQWAIFARATGTEG